MIIANLRSNIQFTKLGYLSCSSILRTSSSSLCRRLYHARIDLEDQERIRLTTRRLYRILLRTCKDFSRIKTSTSSENENHHEEYENEFPILLQPNLEAPDWGRHTTYTPPTPIKMEELYRLFYVWNDQTSDHGLGLITVSPSDDNDDVRDMTSTPSSKTTNVSSAVAYAPTSIDDWYYELVSKCKEENKNDDISDSSSSSSTALPPMTSMTCWTTPRQLQDAVRTAFRNLHYDDSSSGTSSTFHHSQHFEDDGDDPTSTTKMSSLLKSSDLHKWAIRAIQILQEQQILWKHSSVATTDRTVRITATSRCIGITSPTPSSMPPTITTPQILGDATPKYRFAYRIRVENVSDDTTIQLMGRYWHIEEKHNDNHDDVMDQSLSSPMEIDSPVTGAVGQLPVLQPGQVFEYMSGTDLATPKGLMRGHLYMARVPATAQSAKSGDNVEIFLKQRQDQKKGKSSQNKYGEIDDEIVQFFQATVAPFPLEA